MKKYFFMMLALTGMMLTMVSCNKDDIKNYKDSKLTPDEHKVKLETMGKDMISQVNPQEQETLVTTLAVFGTEYVSDESFYETFIIPFRGSMDAPALADYYNRVVNTVISVATENDFEALLDLSMTKAENRKVILYDYLKLIEGKYSYTQADGWKKTGAMDKGIEMTFPVENHTCVLTVAFSGTNTYSYDGVTVELPAQMEFTYKVDGVEQTAIILTDKISKDMKEVECSIVLRIAGRLEWKASVEGKSTSVKAGFSMKAKDKELISLSVIAKGENMTDIDAYKEAFEEGYPTNVIQSGEVSASLMNLRIEGKCDMATIQKKMTELDRKNLIEEQDYIESAKILNENLSLKAYYTDTKEYVAEVVFEPKREINEWTETEDWYFTPVFVFADGSKVELGEFFTEANFSSLISAFYALMGQYMDMINF